MLEAWYCGRSVDGQNVNVREVGKVCVLEVIWANTDFTGNWTERPFILYSG